MASRTAVSCFAAQRISLSPAVLPRFPSPSPARQFSIVCKPTPLRLPAPAPAPSRSLHTSRTTFAADTGIKHVGELTEFQKIVGGDKLTVVDFWAAWCGPCKAIAPKFAQFADSYPNARFVKVDVDEAVEIAAEYGISAMPTFQLYKKGEKVSEIIGANAGALEAAIKKNL
ncbi:thioredoxin-domain-containing protein [Gonapodya prolifera JEL478]|uniref:Thioredoxin-domain-containing protein n=1 Tax=Gonapodya prolifera (strain JEL478) TaxID=1344416 RepID=A0A139AEG9_GONPJ|nr:thioredoxin-domain-containing protein [Gonapodya prolifera JEL478]|eukprot:KXS15212.1 thioredoxin-domain-containing protein [Gonapodya prolifera JEL478]